MHPVEAAARELGYERFSGWTDGRRLIWTTKREVADALLAAGATTTMVNAPSGRVEGWECSWKEGEETP